MAEMPRCRDCRWWTPYEDKRGVTPPEGACERTRRSSDDVRKVYLSPKTMHVAAVDASSGDVEGVTLWLVTSPDFGCVQFEASDADGGA